MELIFSSIHLSLVGQFSGTNLTESIFNVYSAKKISELAPGVGKATDLAIITAEGVRFFDNAIIDILDEIRGDVKKIKPDLSKLDAVINPTIKK